MNPSPITTEDLYHAIVQSTQATSDGFAALNNRLEGIARLTQELTDKHSAYINDVADVVERVAALEKHMPHITKEELYELQAMLQRLVEWALHTAKTVNVPLKLP